MIILSYFNDLSTTAFYFIFFYQQTLPSVFKNKQLFMQLILTKVRAYLYRGNYKVSLCQYIYLQCKLNIMSLPQKFYLWRQITNFDWKLSFVGCFAVVNRRETFLCWFFRVLWIRWIKTLVLAATEKFVEDFRWRFRFRDVRFKCNLY